MELDLVRRTCNDGDCPKLYETDRGTFVVQGSVIDDAGALASLHLPSGESAVEIPRELILGLFNSLEGVR
jgi:hypothetical protein